MAVKWLKELDKEYPTLARTARRLNDEDGFVMAKRDKREKESRKGRGDRDGDDTRDTGEDGKNGSELKKKHLRFKRKKGRDSDDTDTSRRRVLTSHHTTSRLTVRGISQFLCCSVGYRLP